MQSGQNRFHAIAVSSISLNDTDTLLKRHRPLCILENSAAVSISHTKLTGIGKSDPKIFLRIERYKQW